MKQISRKKEVVLTKILYADQEHSFIWFGTESKNCDGSVKTILYLIIDNDEGMLLDPGDTRYFPQISAAIEQYIPIKQINSIFFSHQDPDVLSGISRWLKATDAKVYISALWVRFLPHFGIFDSDRVITIPDNGLAIRQESGNELLCIPTHFMHSPGQFSLYDKRSKILYSTDVGTALVDDCSRPLFVENFQDHLKYIEPFHTRYMASNTVVRNWCEKIRHIEPEMIAPLHSPIYRGDTVGRFLDWLSELKCGSDLGLYEYYF
ncbi:FprA family A-type flavoprotein [Brucepastera parasyntrophica]|uniref:MBL fold metallo-hydrolase n=1 Tax=Brucepastera parasyntrophica TaxID=2880008 RepID=UPI00210E9070|nr:MBL fold metallo-hydrolase [Brucepastera parasyntrophica]ULQ58543.1 FprA family A-type flavoprotein [Brucepastera parasyntrophica]